MAIFGPKPWVNPFGKMSIFRFFERLVFIAYIFFFILEYRKRHFSGLYWLKEKFEKWPFLDQNHVGEPLWEYVIFSTFRTCCFYSLEMRFFVLE